CEKSDDRDRGEQPGGLSRVRDTPDRGAGPTVADHRRGPQAGGLRAKIQPCLLTQSGKLLLLKGAFDGNAGKIVFIVKRPFAPGANVGAMTALGRSPPEPVARLCCPSPILLVGHWEKCTAARHAKRDPDIRVP